MYQYNIYIILFFAFFTPKLITSENVCDDGSDIFHDDYYDICYKYYSGVADYHKMVKECNALNDSSLPTINSKAEQDFLINMMIKYKMVESVWLDASIKDKHIVWSDRSSGEYENWMSGRPVNNDNCVEMLADEVNRGKWEDQPCTKLNGYICKRVVMWSDQETARLIRDERRSLDAAISKINQLEKDLGSKITQLEQTQVPIGFLYVQLPDQAEPKTLWPAYTWSDVTATYAGQFFRAEGVANGSLAFGKGVQPENAPRLLTVSNTAAVGKATLTITPGTWSELLYTGGAAGDAKPTSIKFMESAGEIHPRNQAVRLFKRTK